MTNRLCGKFVTVRPENRQAVNSNRQACNTNRQARNCNRQAGNIFVSYGLSVSKSVGIKRRVGRQSVYIWALTCLETTGVQLFFKFFFNIFLQISLNLFYEVSLLFLSFVFFKQAVQLID